ncbi:pfkA [Symbiodinium necroappetens]|uniref:PfkA protein n=1 Tax=Symbiodinium necroappetens TaxID=1628268 RepID=A0A813CKF2_9DINO|nr:pfkA [Symbiodinium necroappetens]
MLTQQDLAIESLGDCAVDSPLGATGRSSFVDDADGVLVESRVRADAPPAPPVAYQLAGPRRKIFFEPAKTTAALVTCGGLSPGLNNVIRSVVLELAHAYGVRRILGIRNGYRGIDSDAAEPPIELTPRAVADIHHDGGTILASSRGPQDPETAVDFLVSQGVDILFPIGGDGTQRGALVLQREIARRGLPIAVVGIPKTIDNDIPHVAPSFGYATALEAASDCIRGAHVEATGAPNGVALVKLMGRDAGFIAAGAAIVSQDANFVLVPEVPFPLEGEGGFLEALERRVRERGHAVVLVAEGAGQHLFDSEIAETDESGNKRRWDIGVFLKDRIASHFAARSLELTLKYIDPSYLIRSCPANAWDKFLCDRMARAAAHAAMAGKTGMMIGARTGEVYHVPIALVGRGPAVRLDVNGDVWNAALASTGQPRWGQLGRASGG